MMEYNFISVRKPLFSVNALSLTAILLTGNAYAGDWSVGAGVLAEQLPYRDYDAQYIPLPILTYQGEQFFINGQGIGVNLLSSEKHNLHLAVNYSPLSFKPADSDDPAMKKLDKRRATAMAGIGYQYHADWGNINADIATDVMGYSDGVIADVGYQYRFQFGKLQLVPGFGMRWQNRAFNNYYFGISERESQRSGIQQYQAKSGVTSYISLASYYAINNDWQLFLMGYNEQMSDTVKDSPMTVRDYSINAVAGVLYSF
ncbi:MipA/OmpV family protein [Serratia fonticola]|uniref:MipA/OmpV family protein n=1 Tax=Serratia fonticola TaxID=47917 RepID=UPI001378AE2E|nr:MipA/OmpV family protein [Serratia fonticola]MBC3220582.1 MipA/OmpV family protein [Serratia fonticola]NBJ32740.1 MipA/OmpV family protein [Serratia fonticola]